MTTLGLPHTTRLLFSRRVGWAWTTLSCRVALLIQGGHDGRRCGARIALDQDHAAVEINMDVLNTRDGANGTIHMLHAIATGHTTDMQIDCFHERSPLNESLLFNLSHAGRMIEII